MKAITVLLAEDCALMREGLRAILATEGDINVVGEAENGRQAVQLTGALGPDVVVMDVSMPRLNGPEATRQIRASVPGAQVLILSAHNEPTYVEQAAAMGAAGYITKQTAAEDLTAAIRDVHRGDTVFGTVVSASGKRRGKLSGPTHPAVSMTTELTSRETEVLQLIAESEANKQIAAELCISIKTVEKHRTNLMRKINIHDTAGLTRYAIASRVIEVHRNEPWM